MTVPPFERFYAENRDAVFAHLVRLLGRQRAEDAFQETFLRALRGYAEPASRPTTSAPGSSRSRPGSPPTSGRRRRPEPAADLDGGRPTPGPLRADRASRGRAPAEGARRGRAPLRLRPALLGHRHRTRLQRGGRPPGRLLRRPAAAKEAAMTAVPEALDRRFREAAADGGARRRLLRRRRHADRPAARRRHRARPLPDLVRSRAGPRDRDARPRVRRAGPARAARLDPVRRELDEYFEGRRRDFDLPLDLRGRDGFHATPRARSRGAVRRGHDVRPPRRRGRQPPRGPRGRRRHEPQPDPDRAPLPPRCRLQRQPGRLRRRARAEAAAPRPRGGNAELDIH